MKSGYNEIKKSGSKTMKVALSAALAFSAFSFLPAATTVMPNDIPVVSTSVAEAADALKTWDFTSNVGGWGYVGAYAYSGDASAAYDPAFGGSLKVNVDYSGDKDQTWSEVKLSDSSVTKSNPIVVGEGAKSVSFDLYYDPSQIKGDGTLKVKLFGNSVKDEEVINQVVDDLGFARAKSVDGSNLKRARVRIPLDETVKDNIGHFEISVVSYLTSYKGAIYINNIAIQ